MSGFQVHSKLQSPQRTAASLYSPPCLAVFKALTLKTPAAPPTPPCQPPEPNRRQWGQGGEGLLAQLAVFPANKGVGRRQAYKEAGCSHLPLMGSLG